MLGIVRTFGVSNMRFQLHITESLQGFGLRWDESPVGFLAVVNYHSYKRALEAVKSEDTESARAIDTIMNSGGAPVTEKRELFQRWRGWKEGGVLLYIYCHSTGDRLALSAEETIDVQEWVDQLGPIGEREGPIGVVVLNGCFTATGSTGGGFLEATGGDNFCGFVGTEAGGARSLCVEIRIGVGETAAHDRHASGKDRGGNAPGSLAFEYTV